MIQQNVGSVYSSAKLVSEKLHSKNRQIGRTLHGSNIRALDIVLELGNLLLEVIERNELILCNWR